MSLPPFPSARLLRVALTPAALLDEASAVLELTDAVRDGAAAFEHARAWVQGLALARSLAPLEHADWNDDWRDAAGVAFVAECLLRMSIADKGVHVDIAADAEPPPEVAGTRVAFAGFDALPAAPAGFDPAPFEQALQAVRDRGDDAAAHAALAYAVSVDRDGWERPDWDGVCTAERVTAQVWAGRAVECFVASLPRRLREPDATLAPRVRRWHEEAMAAQQSDELLVAIVDDLVRLNMLEAEVRAPETMRVFRSMRPRMGYEWYTRLRAARPPAEVNRLHERCTPRPLELDPDMKEQTIDAFVDYHMRHAGMRGWRAETSFSWRHPFEAMRVLFRGHRVRIGIPNGPPILLRTPSGGFRVLDIHQDVLTVVYEQAHGEEGGVYQALGEWCMHVLEKRRGLLGPRIHVGGLLERITAPMHDPRVEDERRVNVTLAAREAPMQPI